MYVCLSVVISVYEVTLYLYDIFTQGGERNNAQYHFNQLTLALETYYHPSNVGKHTVSQIMLIKGYDARVHMCLYVACDSLYPTYRESSWSF